jgi:hypothetical protein
MNQDSQTKPLFTDWNSYQKWLQEWKAVIHYLNSVCLNRKKEIKDLNRSSQFEQLKRAREKYKYDRIMVTKMLTLHNEAVIRWKNIKVMNKAIQDQFDKFPLEIKDTKVIDFHFSELPHALKRRGLRGQTSRLLHPNAPLLFPVSTTHA